MSLGREWSLAEWHETTEYGACACAVQFFASNIKTTSERQKKQCMMSEGCTVQEKFSSRYEDMKLSM